VLVVCYLSFGTSYWYEIDENLLTDLSHWVPMKNTEDILLKDYEVVSSCPRRPASASCALTLKGKQTSTLPKVTGPSGIDPDSCDP
jgi:hypothetical protein